MTMTRTSTSNLLVEKIRQLQKDEGSTPCFRSGVIFCPHMTQCCWGEVCDQAVIHRIEVVR